MIGLWSLWLGAAAVAMPFGGSESREITLADLARGSIVLPFDGDIGEVRFGASPEKAQLCGAPSKGTLVLEWRRNPGDPCSALLAPATKAGVYQIWVSNAARTKWTEVVLTRRDGAPTLAAPFCVGGTWVAKLGVTAGSCSANGSVVLSQRVVEASPTSAAQVVPAPGLAGLSDDKLYYRWTKDAAWQPLKGNTEGLVFGVSGTEVTVTLPPVTIVQRVAELQAGTSSLEIRADLSGRSPTDLGWTLGLAPAALKAVAPGDGACASAPTADQLERIHPGMGTLPYVLCVDLASAAPRWRMYSAFPEGVIYRHPDGQAGREANEEYQPLKLHETVSPYLIPNVPVVVLAYPAEGQTVSIGATGTVGLSDGAAYAGFKSGETVASKSGPTASGPAPLANVLVPRTPGAFDVVVSAAPPATEAKASPPATASVTHEMLVVPTYFGALRVGFAGVVAPHDPGWDAVEQPDGSTVLTRTRARPVLEPELVVGFSTFYSRASRYRIPDLQVGPRYRFRGGFYTGVGVLSQASESQGAVAFLRSVYLGQDVELNPHASVALAAVVRRTTVPIAGFDEGDLVSSGTDWSVPRPTVGFAVSVNVTPWFFRQLPGASLESVGMK